MGDIGNTLLRVDLASSTIKSTTSFGTDASCKPELSQSRGLLALHVDQAELSIIDSGSLQAVCHADLRAWCESEQQQR